MTMTTVSEQMFLHQQSYVQGKLVKILFVPLSTSNFPERKSELFCSIT